MASIGTGHPRHGLSARGAIWILSLAWLIGFASGSPGAEPSRRRRDGGHNSSLDSRLARVLSRAGFTGRIEASLERKLGRSIDHKLARLGNALFFDKQLSLHRDNACAGCHSPTNGFGDTQSIAIGIQNNNLVGPNRSGPRNQRRTPMVLNNAFYPKLMWNGRFRSLSDDPFDNSDGFELGAACLAAILA
jgi:cytochrome c peroxidase